LKQHSFPTKVSVGNPVRSSIEREQIEKVRQAAWRLPGKYRDVIVLKYLEELPTHQILDILNLSENAFYTRLNRARTYLQELLSGDPEDKNE